MTINSHLLSCRLIWFNAQYCNKDFSFASACSLELARIVVLSPWMSGAASLLRQLLSPTIHTSDTSRPWLVHYSFLRQSRPWLVHFSLLRHFLLPFGVCSIPPTNPITPTIHFSDNHIMSTSPTKILSSLLRQNYFAHISDENNSLISPTKSIYLYF